jgi:hypothetical protein
MTIWTNIPNANLEAGAPVRSVDHLAMRDNDVYLRAPILGTILSEQTITTSGTWTKPTGSQFENTDFLCFLVVGAGGAGGLFRTSVGVDIYGQGGQGGRISLFAIKYLNCPSSATITIGAGGLGTTRTNNASVNGPNGGNTSLAMTGFATVSAVGGIGGLGVEGTFSITTQPRQFRIYEAGVQSFGYIAQGGVGAIVSNTGRVVAAEGVNFGFSDGTGGLGAGGGTAIATNGTLGAGGGGAASRTSATSGNGGNGIVKVFIVRGSSFNILNYLQDTGVRVITGS